MAANYNIVLILPYIKMNPPRVYTCFKSSDHFSQFKCCLFLSFRAALAVLKLLRLMRLLLLRFCCCYPKRETKNLAVIYSKTCLAHIFLKKFRASILPFSSLIDLEFLFCMRLGRNAISFTFHLFQEPPTGSSALAVNNGHY